MNERIDILFGQALDSAVPETWTTLDADQLDRLKDKLAELIIRECARWLENREFASPEALKQHFGVEE